MQTLTDIMRQSRSRGDIMKKDKDGWYFETPDGRRIKAVKKVVDGERVWVREDEI